MSYIRDRNRFLFFKNIVFYTSLLILFHFSVCLYVLFFHILSFVVQVVYTFKRRKVNASEVQKDSVFNISDDDLEKVLKNNSVLK